MRVLFVPSRFQDGLSDVVYSGLNLIPNVEVHEFPFKHIYHHGMVQTEAKNSDYVGTRVSNASPKWILQEGKNNHIYDHMEEIDFDIFDYIILSSLKEDLDVFIENIVRESSDRLVLLDGEDDPFIRHRIRSSGGYFKREKFRSDFPLNHNLNRRNILRGIYQFKRGTHTSRYLLPFPPIPPFNRASVPLNLTVIPHDYGSPVERDIDVSLVATVNNGIRQKAVDDLREISREHGLKSFINVSGIPPSEYVDVVMRSKIAISLPGAGWDTFRYWEIPYYGTCMLSYNLPLDITNNFEDGHSALFYGNRRDMEKSIIQGLKGDFYDDIGHSGKEHMERYHTPIQRASSILSLLT